MEEQRSFDLNADPEGPVPSTSSNYAESETAVEPTNAVGAVPMSEVDVKQLEFESLEKLHQWYIEFGYNFGFSVRAGGVLKDKKTGESIGKYFYCSCEGFREEKYLKLENRCREPRSVTRTGCKARIRARFFKDIGIWKISVFCNDHNHEMVVEKQRPMLRSHREITDGEYAQAALLKRAGVDTGQIMMFYTEQAGGALRMKFNKRDLQNRIQREKGKTIEGGDIQNSLAYFDAKKEMDSGFYYNYTLDSEGTLENLLWADAGSRLDYQVFGDVISFDATYKKNAYNLPLLVFVGVNNHHQTIIFALAVLANEKHESYVWVLNEFLRCMGGKQPISVVTDGDRAMLSAVKEVMPQANHRLCVWHIQKNLYSNIHQAEVRKAFKRCMYSKWTEEVFNQEWEAMVEQYRLSSNSWISEKFKTRKYWAQSLLTGKFFGRVMTTSRNEGVNSYLKRYVRKTNCFMEFVTSLDVALSNMRRNESDADFKSRYSKPLIKTDFEELLSDAARVYTLNSFRRFRKEMNRSNSLIIRCVCFEKDSVGHDTKKYTMSKYRRPEKEVTVIFNLGLNTIRCSCLKFESDGIPCRHSVKLMINEAMKAIPQSCILPRWTLNAKSDLNSLGDTAGFDNDSVRRFRQSMIVSIANRLSFPASANETRFQELRDSLLETLRKWEKADSSKAETQRKKRPLPKVGDPVRRSTWYQPSKSSVQPEKGKKRTYQCGNCDRKGHNRLSCPELNNNQTPAADSDSEFDSSDEELGQTGGCWADAAARDEEDEQFPDGREDAELNYEAEFSKWL